MKKVFSLIVTAAMLFSMAILPSAVFAEDIELFAAGSGNVKITYDAQFSGSAVSESNPVHPGDEFTVDVKITPSAEMSFEEIDLDITYDKTQFTYKSMTEASGISAGTLDSASNTGLLRYINSNPVTAPAAGLTLLTLNFEVNAGAAVGSSNIGVTPTNPDTAFVDSNGMEYRASDNNVTEEPVSVNVAANTITVKVQEKVLTPGVSGGTFYEPAGVKVTIEGSNITAVTIAKDSDPAESLTVTAGKAEKDVTVEGSYTVTVTANGMTAKTYTFTLSTADVQATLSTSVTSPKEEGYAAGDVIEIPVIISGLDTAQAAMVSFNVTYDSNVFDFAVTGSGAQIKNGSSVVYGDEKNSSGLADNAAVATLQFTVKSGESVKLGDYELKISDAQLALVTDTIDPTDRTLGITKGIEKITVVAAEVATLNNETVRNSWTTGVQKYDITATPLEGVTVSYIKVSEVTSPDTATQTGLEAIYNAGKDAGNEKNTITIDAEADYYVVAKVGSVYKLIKELKNGVDIFFDATAPVITLTGSAVSMTAFKSSAAIAKADITVTDTVGEWDEKLYYSLNPNDTTPTWNEMDENGISITTNMNGNLGIKAVDKAGNEKIETITIKVDADAPVVSATADGPLKTGNKKDIKITVTDGGDSGVTTAAVYYGNAQEGVTDLDTIKAMDSVNNAVTLSEGTDGDTGKFVGELEVGNPGTYYVIVADGAGNEGLAEVKVELASISAASALIVETVAGAGYKEGFIPDGGDFVVKDKSGAVIQHNGWFTRVAIDAKDAPAGFENTFTYTKDGGAETACAANMVFDQPGEYAVTVKTAHTSSADVAESATYKFWIVAAADMPSVDGDKRYNIIDFSRIKRLIGSNTAGVLPDANSEFPGGMFSGDVNGDLTMTSDDYAAILQSLRKLELPGAYYSLPIMNQTAPATQGE